MTKYAFAIGMGLLASLINQNVLASPSPDQDLKAAQIQEISEFLGVPATDVKIECPQNTLKIEGDGADKHLNICLNYRDNQKRCEVTLTGLDPAPAQYDISVDIKEAVASPSDRWHTVMQMHSFPDDGEKWRCPPLSVEVEKRHFRAFSRWDKNAISTTSGNNCTEAGSSIKAREVIGNVPVHYNSWQNFQLMMLATPSQNGQMKLKINQASSKRLDGGNLYNDKRAPFLKLGVYKPAGWSQPEIQSGQPVCVSYKNFKMVSSKK